jgi:hypothetical protein
MSTLGDAADVNPKIKLLQHLAVDSSDSPHGTLSQLWWHMGHIHTFLDVTPYEKNHRGLGQLTVEARECVQSNDQED